MPIINHEVVGSNVLIVKTVSETRNDYALYGTQNSLKYKHGKIVCVYEEDSAEGVLFYGVEFSKETLRDVRGLHSLMGYADAGAGLWFTEDMISIEKLSFENE